MDSNDEMDATDVIDETILSSDRPRSPSETQAAVVALRAKIYQCTILTVDSIAKNNDFEVENFMKQITKSLEDSDYCDIFVRPLHKRKEDPVREGEKSELSKAYTKWVFARLFFLLSRKCSEEVRSSCVEFIISVLHAITYRDPIFFSEMLSDVVQVTTDMMKVYDKLKKKNGNESNLHFIWFKSGIKKYPQENLVFEQLKIDFDNVDQCDALQTSIMEITSRTELESLDSEDETPFWKSLCFHLEIGSYDLKQITFKAIAEFIEAKGIPDDLHLQEYLFDCLRAFFLLLCTGEFSNYDKLTTLEEHFSLCLSSILDTKNFRNYLNFIPLSTFFENFLKIINQNGLNHIIEAKTFQSICEVFVYMVLNFHKCPQVKTKLMKLASVALIEHLLLKCDTKWVAQCFFELMKEELSLNSFRVNLFAQEQNLNTSSSFDYMAATFCNESQFQASYFDPALLSPLWAGLQRKFKSILQHFHDKNFEQLELMLPELKVIVTVGSVCTVNFRLSDQNKTKRELKWFYEESPSILCEICLELLDSRPSLNVYSTAVLVCSALLYGQEKLSIPEIWPAVIAIVSLPWLNVATSSDQNVTNHLTKLSATCGKIPFDDDIETLKLCLWTLALMPKNVEVNLRFKIFREILGGSDSIRQALCLDVFPLILHQMGNERRENLIYILESRINHYDFEGKLAIAKSLGSTPCILHEKTILIPQKLDTFCLNGFLKSFRIYCTACENDRVNDNRLTQPNLLPKKTVTPYLKLISHEQREVKLAFTKSLKSIFRHVSMDQIIMKSLMDFIEDDDAVVCHSFNIEFPLCVNIISISPLMLDAITGRLTTAFSNATNNSDSIKQETILNLVGQLGSVVVDTDLMGWSINVLVRNLTSSTILRSASAIFHLNGIATAKKCSITKIYVQFKKLICEYLCKDLLELEQINTASVGKMLETVGLTFGFPDKKIFLKSILKHLLPITAAQANKESSALLKCFANIVAMSIKEMLQIYIKDIYIYLACFLTRDQMFAALGFVSKEAGVTAHVLLKGDYQSVLNEILLRIGAHYDPVVAVLVTLLASDVDPSNKEKIPVKTVKDVAELLHPRLLGFLCFFDSQILNSSIPLADKKLTLQSLSKLIEIMGSKYITPIRSKVIATLRYSLQYQEPELVDLVCTTWWTFVQNLEVASLGPLLSSIIVPLLTLLETKPEEISRIYNYLIVEKKDSNKLYFKDLYLLPDIPELIDVNSVLEAHNTKPTNQEEFRHILQYSLKNITHENLDVRIQGFKKLKFFLRTYKEFLLELILGNESLDSIISQLIKTMIVSCRETDTRIRSLIGECLGELGAVDPGRLQIDNNYNTDMTKIYCDVLEENFAFDLILELVRSFLAAEGPRVQNCSAYAIQVLLPFYNCKPSDDPRKHSSQLWDRIPEDSKEILQQMFNSKYSVDSQPTKYQYPIYFSNGIKTFKDWVCAWCEDLITRVKQKDAAQVFSACHMLVKYDFNTALFILPYALLYALLEDSKSIKKDQIEKEILTVLNHNGVTRNVLLTRPDVFHMSTQAVFSVLDFLKKWLTKVTISMDTYPTVNFKAVQNFLEKIPEELLLKTSYDCQAHTRAIMHCEFHIKNEPESQEHYLEMLQKLYIALDEPDAVAGLAAIRKDKLQLTDKISIHESTGQFQDAFSCYEQAISRQPGELKHYQGILRSLMSLGQPTTALTYANGVLAKQPNWRNGLNQFLVESAWKLGDWSSLESFLKTEDDISLCSSGVAIGELLLSAYKREEPKFVKLLENIVVKQMGPLSAAGMENFAYQRGYEYLIRLHMLNEVEKGMTIFLNFTETLPHDVRERKFLNQTALINQWDSRIKFIQLSLRHIEPILSLRRVVFDLAKKELPDLKSCIDNQIGYSWLLSAKAARKSGNMQHAYSCLLEASNFKLKETFLEYAKWHWSKLEKEQALLCLQRGLQEHFESPNMRRLSEEEKLLYAKSKLQLVRYSEESGNVETVTALKMFTEVQTIDPQWEDAHFYLAQYLDRVFYSPEAKTKQWTMIPRMVEAYRKCLQFDSHFAYQAMPRMLSIWLDLGSQPDARSGEVKTVLDSVNRLMHENIQILAPHKFLIAFPQLVSRICHSHPAVFKILTDIIAKLMVTYPQQAMWQIIAVSKSSYPIRAQQFYKIFRSAITLDSSLNKFFEDVTQLVDAFLQLSNCCDDKKLAFSIRERGLRIERLLNQKSFSKIMLPLQSAMTVNLPYSHTNCSNRNPFSQELVYIQGIEDRVEIMQSLAKPKKISLRGSDGKLYAMMCKPKDDLRKDCRLMEFNALVNKLLLRDPEARRRQLHLRTYTVVPLNEDCGLIEWVPGLTTILTIFRKLYAEKKIAGNVLRKPDRKDSLELKLKIFRDNVRLYPPVLSEWFLQTFLDPTAWYLVRLSYARTLAVMSMVGYILGLGDRHGDNILLDNSCGDIVHVDFSCLFNKGMEFEWSEIVPFRLTQNLVDAMGITGTEGVYRKACEVTMRVMRKQKATLMSVLRPFIHDPLCEWTRNMRGVMGNRGNVRENRNTTGEVRNEKALQCVRDIEQRLKGIDSNQDRPNQPKGLPLSIEGHVNYLIEEATSQTNLCQMYPGWAPYM